MTIFWLADESFESELDKYTIYYMVTIGGSSSVYSIGSFGELHNVELSAAGEAWHARQFVDSVADVADNLQVEVRHVRIAIEESHDHDVGIFDRLSPSFSIGLREDGRNEKSVFGLDIGSSFVYDAFEGLEVQGSGRSLLSGLNRMHKWEIESSLDYDSGNDNKNMLFNMSRTWNNTDGNTRRFIWESELVDTSTIFIGNHAGGSIEIGYGFEFLAGSALITPYSKFSQTDSRASEFQFGSRLKTATGVDFRLEAVRTVPESGAVGHEFSLTGGINW